MLEHTFNSVYVTTDGVSLWIPLIQTINKYRQCNT